MPWNKTFLVSAFAMSLVSSMAQAEAGFGAGLTYVFGEGVAIGAKIFTSNKEDKAVGSAGLDYLVKSGDWRPNIGIGYLGKNTYGDVNAGYNYHAGEWSFGVGIGGVNTEDDKLPVTNRGSFSGISGSFSGISDRFLDGNSSSFYGNGGLYSTTLGSGSDSGFDSRSFGSGTGSGITTSSVSHFSVSYIE